MRDVQAVRTVLAGRSTELAWLGDRLERAVQDMAQLALIEGPAGIGKTALLNTFIETARDASLASVHGIESDQLTSFATAITLMRAAGGATESIRATSEPAAVGAALLEQFTIGCRDRPLIVVIDDAQWMDRLSIRAVAFALRRLETAPLLTIVASRPHQKFEFDALRLLAQRRTGERITVGGLTRTHLVELGEALTGETLPRGAAGRLQRHTGGSPLYARALFAELGVERIADLDRPLPAPRSYPSFVAALLDQCSEPVRRLLVAVAVLGERCSLDEALALSGNVPLTTIEESTGTTLLTIDCAGPNSTCRFRTELARTAIYDELSAAERADLHAHAARIVTDRDSVLRHRRLAATSPDDHVADALADRAAELSDQGQLAAAAAHFMAASSLRSTKQAADRDLLDSADLSTESGEPETVERVWRRVVDLPGSPRRSFALGVLELAAGDPGRAEAHLVEAWSSVAGTDRELAARVADRLCQLCCLQLRTDEADLWGARTRDLTGQTSDWYVTGLAMGGNPSLDDVTNGQTWSLEATLARGARKLWTDDLVSARVDLLAAFSGFRHGGQFQRSLQVLTYLTLAEHRLGAWDDAVAHGEEGVALARDADQRWVLPVLHAILAMTTAWRGDLVRAHEHIEAARETAAVTGQRMDLEGVTIAEATIAAVAGDHEKVVDLLGLLLGGPAAAEALEPGVSTWRIVLATSLIRLGRVCEAEAVVKPFETRAVELGRSRARSAAARVRAMIAAESDQPERAERAFHAAMTYAEVVGSDVDLAFARFEYGRFLVAVGRHYAAVAELRGARSILQKLGTRPGVAACDRQLALCGVVPLDEAHLIGLLAPRELAVARLVVDGRSDREVAAELMISTNAVGVHVRAVIAKLGVRTRADAAQTLGRR